MFVTCWYFLGSQCHLKVNSDVMKEVLYPWTVHTNYDHFTLYDHKLKFNLADRHIKGQTDDQTDRTEIICSIQCALSLYYPKSPSFNVSNKVVSLWSALSYTVYVTVTCQSSCQWNINTISMCVLWYKQSNLYIPVDIFWCGSIGYLPVNYLQLHMYWGGLRILGSLTRRLEVIQYPGTHSVTAS